MRAEMSSALPGGVGTSRRTGLSGQVCAAAEAANVAASAQAVARRSSRASEWFVMHVSSCCE